MSEHIVFSVPCLWQRGIHSLQGLPSILLIKQWVCTQPIQGRENATQRDVNIKHLAIWEGRVPNNDSLVIMKPLFFFSRHTPKTLLMIKKYVWVLIYHVFLWHWSDSPFLCEKETARWIFLTWREKNCQFKDDWFHTPPPTLNSLPCNLFSTCFC